MGIRMAAQQTEVEKAWEELERLHQDALTLLARLDTLGLFQASAYVSMAIDVMQRQHPDLDSCEGNSRT